MTMTRYPSTQCQHCGGDRNGFGPSTCERCWNTAINLFVCDPHVPECLCWLAQTVTIIGAIGAHERKPR